jgi:hypothetical protein
MGARQDLQHHTRLNGVAKVSLNGEVTWTGRFITMNAVHPDTNNIGFWDMVAPTGAVAVVGGGTRPVNAAAGGNTGGVLLNNWDALWYRLPFEAANTTVNANYLIVPYTAVFDADEHWIMVVAREDDNTYRMADGSTLTLGEQSGTKDAQNTEMSTNLGQWYGLQFAAPGFAAVVPGAMAYGFTGSLRTLGAGVANEQLNSGYFDVLLPTVGTVIYDAAGAPSGRTWRAPVAADRMSHMGDLPRSGYGYTAATHPLADIVGNETLWFNANPQTTSGGTWHITPYTANFGGRRSNWIRVATFQVSQYNGLNVFGERAIACGDFVSYNDTVTQQGSIDLTRFSPGLQTTPMVAWTPVGHFTGAAANGITSGAYGVFVKWSGNAYYTGISHGFSSAGSGGGGASGNQYLSLTVPAAGTQIPVIGYTGLTRTVDALMGIPLGPWEALYYVPPAYIGGTGSVDAGWVVAAYSVGAALPHNAIKVAQFLWEGRAAGLVAAPPFAGTNITGGYQTVRLWFLGTFHSPGAGVGAIGNLGTIGGTEAFRTLSYGAAAGGIANVQSYPGFEAGYRLNGEDRSLRRLQTVGLIQFPAAGTLNVGAIIAFMPGVTVTRPFLTQAMFFVSTAVGYITIDLRLTNATVLGVAGAQVSVAGISNTASRTYTASAWIDLRALDGKNID